MIVANCSGFYGDRLSAMREMLDGGPVDVITGDYLAELTMLILGKDQLRDPSLGYARTFVTQIEQCLGGALSGVRIVSNAGSLNPIGLAERIREAAAGLGLSPTIGVVDGDDLAPAGELGFEGALTANAYLGGFGIARALAVGADVVVTGRVTDASVVVGPGIWRFGWGTDDHDALAGAVAAGHVIECGTHATGGNFSGFMDLPRDARPLGFPIAELHADGSSVITKHPGTGGMVTIDTVTAQLMYEIQGPVYDNPDVRTDLRSIELSGDGRDRVRISGVTGSAPPEQLKVATNTLGGHRNQMEFVLVGLDLDAKEAWLREQMDAALADRRPAEVSGPAGLTLPPTRTPRRAPPGGCVAWSRTPPPRWSARRSPPRGRAGAGVVPGFTLTAPPGKPSPFGVYRPAYVDRNQVHERVLVDGVEIGEAS